MFVTKKRHETEIEELRRQIGFDRDRYWDLWNRLEALTEYLGLEVAQKPSTIVVQKRDVPNAIELTGSPLAASPATGGSDVE